MASSSSTEISSSDVLVEAHDRSELDEEQQQQQQQRDEKEEILLRFPDIPHIRIPDRSSESSSNSAWSSAFHARSHSTTPRSRQGSPRSSPVFRDFGFGSNHGSPSLPTRFSNSHRSNSNLNNPWSVFKVVFGFFSNQKQQQQQQQQQQRGKRKTGRVWYRKKRIRGLVIVIALIGFFFLMNWWMLSRLQDDSGLSPKAGFLNVNSSSVMGKWSKFAKGKRPQRIIFSRMLALAAHALAEGEKKPEPKDLWEEPLIPASAWIPCAEERNWEPCDGHNGYIIVSANGGMNQQRVAVCNAVTLARLLNSTLVVPKFLFSSVWTDVSQFSDIYQEEHFINYLKPDIRVVKELPVELQSLDLEAIGSVVTDADIMKEAKPSFYLKHILPILLQNRVVHLVGFGNRLAFDPIPFDLQRLRCRCNFHALRFVPKIQETGALLLKRLRQHKLHWGPLDHYLVGPFAADSSMDGKLDHHAKKSRYLALHLRFEIDMAAHSMCEFGGGEEEREELEAYRAIHFPALTHLMKTTKLPSAAVLRSEGQCPLTPEEAVLMLAALGFKRKTRVYLAGAHIYGGKSRLAALTNLYPNLVTKENLLSSSEIEPFMNFSSQLAALDFIGCAASDAFAMTDSGSQLSSLVTGYRIYFGGGRMPTIRPNKRRLASIFMKNSTIEWREFEERVRKAVRQSKQVQERPVARSIYRHPRCEECMCNITATD
ncbi:GDP-fucose protein O-fucosyltransferase [Macleaya cordata]|uniref:O-fucosyltransferase family protein n=1 Tax=Macleaya cordata TaxID=56857 RepID=A0A200RBA3_MACCD|nr:GDP-fucose protein O-fucosyltransferase [Macleaya cordata]